MKLETLKAVQAARDGRHAIVLAKRIADGAEALVSADSATGDLATHADVVALAREALTSGRSDTVDTSVGKVFLQAFIPPPRLIVVGAVHIAQALVPMAAMTGLDVIVIDPRRAFAADYRFPNVTVLQDWPDEAMEKLKPDATTAVVTLTHDPKLDDPALDVALRSDAFYVGSLGSRRTHDKRKARLLEAGITEAQFARIHGPVGLNIGAKSPAEIAISILAEIIQARAALNEPAERKVKAA
ncbi:XdhC family protein [Reyranella sp. CPCC 100927]|uniref:XdhC family protein n=1 Tax=Reyranella sp. CPCC 100927 TaxID=2599616 RepID=UPI0011B43779|nr:XdhC family protein [Reyranella sp. CPCC 100927]TWT01632.1 xanthine dehydrogenase [Reyranella sp. CPCC 100927]